MLKEQVAKLLNEQVNKEFFSSYLYLDFSTYFADRGLDGFANWYMIQAQEEKDHALMFYNYLLEHGEKVKLLPIEGPSGKYKDDISVLKAALAHEKQVTEWIHKIYEAAEKEKDFSTMQFLHWFIEEQREEEANASDLVTKMEMFGSQPQSLYMLNSDLKGRSYVPPQE